MTKENNTHFLSTDNNIRPSGYKTMLEGAPDINGMIELVCLDALNTR